LKGEERREKGGGKVRLGEEERGKGRSEGKVGKQEQEEGRKRGDGEGKVRAGRN